MALAPTLRRIADRIGRALARRDAERPDAAVLRDLGIHACEWSSVQAEIDGRAAPTRRRIAP
jgi:hypothetical protein